MDREGRRVIGGWEVDGDMKGLAKDKRDVCMGNGEGREGGKNGELGRKGDGEGRKWVGEEGRVW